MLPTHCVVVRLLRALALLLAVPGCGGDDAPVPSYDLDLDPTELEHASLADPCAHYPGGTLAGDDGLVRVDKDPARQLRSDWAPPDLSDVDDAYVMPGRSAQLAVGAREALYAMLDAALQEKGLSLAVRSAYRSFREQCITYQAKVEQHGAEHAARYSALPGRSQHQLGTAVDLSSAALGWELTPTMGTHAEGEWLADNAWRFGFALSYPKDREDETGYAYEPWHHRFVGKAATVEMRAHELELAAYLEACEAGDPALDCPRDAGPSVNAGFIGGACVHDDECATIGTGAFCNLQDRAAGECTLPCQRLCPDRPGLNAATFCTATGDGDAGLCASRCDTDLLPGDGCREGYGCATAERPDGTGSAPVCVPDDPDDRDDDAPQAP